MSRPGLASLAAACALALCGAACFSPGSPEDPPPQDPPPEDPPPEDPPPPLTPPPRPDPRARSTAEGSCDGLLDYGDELRIEHAAVVGRTYLDAATVELDLTLDLRNAGPARFASASVVPDLAALADLGVAASPPPLPADVGALEPGALAATTAPLRVRLPAANEAALLARLEGGVALHAEAEEVNQLAPDVRVLAWTATEDRMYHLATLVSPDLNPDPGPGPFAPGQQFVLSFIETATSDQETIFDHLEPGTVTYLVEDPAVHGNVNLPPAFRHVRLVEANEEDPQGGPSTVWWAVVRLANDEPLPQVFTTASHCTGRKAHVDPPVQATRVYRVDGDTIPDDERDGNGQPVRMNGLVLENAAIRWSGQVAGHVLKPSLGLKLREGHLEVDASFENAVSFTAELEGEAFAELDAPPAPLWEPPLCFPLPPLVIGPTETPLSLRLGQEVRMTGTFGGGARVSAQKRFENGVRFHCEAGPGVTQACTAEAFTNDTPLEVTPPTFSEGTGHQLRAETTFRALLRVGDETCSTGPGVSLDAAAYAAVGISLADDPLWSVGYGVELTGVVDLEVLGLDLKRYEAPLYTHEWEPETSSAHPPPEGAPGARRVGADQRWAVAIDQTPVPNGVDLARVAALTDGSSLWAATEPIGGRNPLLKLDRHGALEWVKALGKKVRTLRALPDGTAVVAGANAWIVRVDGDGQLLWSFDGELGRSGISTARCVLADVAAIETAPGAWDVVGVGQMGTATVSDRDACAFRVRPDRSLAWSRIYAAEGGQSFDAAVVARDGDLVVAGSDHWEYVGNRQAPLVVRLDAATGDVRWARKLPLTRLAGLDAVVEAEDGTLFASGHAQGTILTTGAALVARLSAAGEDVRHAMLFEDATWEQAFDAAWSGRLTFDPWVDTGGGDTAYDGFAGLALAGGGVVVAGTTGLGAGTAARLARLNANLGVEWMTVLDGPAGDGFSGVAAAGDGLLVAGWSASLPEADGGAGENQLWALKLPLTGSLRFLPDVPVTVRYSASGVRATSTDLRVAPAGAALDAALAYEDPLVLSAAENPALLAAPSAYCVRRLTDTGHPTTTDACPEP